jgi:hypothetical protein
MVEQSRTIIYGKCVNAQAIANVYGMILVERLALESSERYPEESEFVRSNDRNLMGQGMASRLLGFDARLNTRPSAYSIDVCLWPRIDDAVWSALALQVANQLGRSGDAVLNYVNLLCCIPRNWLVNNPLAAEGGELIAVVGSESHAARLKSFFPDMFSWYQCGLSEDDLVQSGWYLIGYDVVDTMLNTSFLRVELEGGANSIGTSWGLYDTVHQAQSALRFADIKVPEHAPFNVVQVYAHPRAFKATELKR